LIARDDQWARSEARIKAASPNGFEMLKPDRAAADGHRAPRTGELMRNPTLAATFRLLGQHGKKGFYEGRVAEAIAAAVTRQGGRLSLADLQEHGERGSDETEPLHVRFSAMGANAERGGLDVWEHPPNGQGIVALMALGILQQLYDEGKMEKWTAADHDGVECAPHPCPRTMLTSP
jgi:gamma-glutamyltranspeptidase / glutathione hydrolase